MQINKHHYETLGPILNLRIPTMHDAYNVAMTDNAVAAGWYRDGQDPRLRYWDGQAWTDRFDDAIWIGKGKPLTGIGAGKFCLTETLLTIERGTVRGSSQQVATHEIQDVDVVQSVSQKARIVGTIRVTAVRATGTEVLELEDVPDFRQARDLINSTAYEARARHLANQQTSTVRYESNSRMPINPLSPSSPDAFGSSPSLSSQIAELRGLHEEGILTDEEFAAGKAKILGM